VNGDFSFFLDSEHPLQVMNAVAALLVLDDGRHILQLRDNKPQIFYPDHWGLFGGAVDEGEHEVEALQRELREELGFAPGRVDLFVRLSFDLSSIGAGSVYRAVYSVPVAKEQMAAFELQEGVAFEALAPGKILTELRVTPYDSFAIWMHYARSRLKPAPHQASASAHFRSAQS
jgi:8-oxo-dGTP pyrophosphatase MutT (NUDIX family)